MEHIINIDRGFSWTYVFRLPFKTTLDTQLRFFQYRINHRILGTNSLLHKIGIRNTNSCTFCQRESETIEHLLWNCPITQTFISSFKNWVINNCNSINTIDLTIASFLFGTMQYGTVFNKILMRTKLYIYKCKMREITPAINGLKFDIRYLFDIENTIALKESNLNNFEKLWEPFKNLYAHDS